MTVAATTILGLAALLFGGVLFNPAAASGSEPTMTATQIIPLVILVVMFVVATKWPLNIGVMGLVASFGVGYFILGMSDKEILEEFPASIVLTIIGVTYFFSMAQRNGTIDIIVQTCVRLVRGKTALLPWVFFLMAAALTALGTFSPAAVALLAPAALGLAYESRIHPVLMGAFVINGAHAGGFSPLSVAGVLVHDIALKNGFPISQGALFAASFALNLILSALTIVLFALLGKLRDKPRQRIRRPRRNPRRASERPADLYAGADRCDSRVHPWLPHAYRIRRPLGRPPSGIRQHQGTQNVHRRHFLVHRPAGGRHDHLRLPAPARRRHRYPRRAWPSHSEHRS